MGDIKYLDHDAAQENRSLRDEWEKLEKKCNKLSGDGKEGTDEFKKTYSDYLKAIERWNCIND